MSKKSLMSDKKSEKKAAASSQPEQDDDAQGGSGKASASNSFSAGLMHRLAEWIGKVDIKAVRKRVAATRKEFPKASPEELADILIKQKCQHTARIGAATAAAGAIPVVGTFVSLTLGMAIDLGAVITAQAELVLELAEVSGVSLTQAQRRETVFVVLGLGAGLEHLGTMASQGLLRKLAQRYSQRWLAHAIPLLGIASSAGLNAFSTYLIGQRAKIFFRDGAASLGDWKASLRAFSGIDEKRLSGWLKEQGHALSPINWVKKHLPDKSDVKKKPQDDSDD